MTKPIFRKAALEKLSSPEQLDQLIRITNPMGWIAVIGIGCLLAAAIIWGIVGSIPVRVAGEGMLVKSGGVFSIISETNGRIKDIYYGPGEIVKEGEIVARVTQPDLQNNITKIRGQLKDLHKKYEMVKKFGLKEMALQIESLTQKKINIKLSVKSLQERIQWLQKRIKNQEFLYKKGLLTRQQLLLTKQTLNDVKGQILGQKQQLKQIKANQLQLKVEKEETLNTIQEQIDTAQQNLVVSLRNLDKLSKVISYYTGRIIEVDMDPGGVVTIGSPLMKLELTGKTVKNLEGVIYFPASKGKKIQLGMRAKIAPSTVQQDEYGLMLGMVTYVSEFPTTQPAMMKEMKNEALVRELMQGGPPIEVHVALIPDPRTPSGFKWTSSKGPPVKIGAGTLCVSMVDIKEKRPIEFVIPLFKKYILGVGNSK